VITSISLIPVGEGPPLEHRLKRLLKLALRSCCLKCVGISQAAADAPSASDPTVSHLKAFKSLSDASGATE
jgi:hypothetical protein